LAGLVRSEYPVRAPLPGISSCRFCTLTSGSCLGTLELDNEVSTLLGRPLFFPVDGINADKSGVELKVSIVSWTGVVAELASFVTAIGPLTIGICGGEPIACVGAYTFASCTKLPSLVLEPVLDPSVNGLDRNPGSAAVRFCS
jgi:hypothetical protein